MANKVELYNNGTLIGTDNAPVVSGGNWTYSIPYTADIGNDVLTVKAFVDNVEVASSGVRNVVVNAAGGGGVDPSSISQQTMWHKGDLATTDANATGDPITTSTDSLTTTPYNFTGNAVAGLQNTKECFDLLSSVHYLKAAIPETFYQNTFSFFTQLKIFDGIPAALNMILSVQEGSGANNRLMIYINPTGKLVIAFTVGGTAVTITSNNALFADGAASDFSALDIVFNSGGNIEAYLNGTSIALDNPSIASLTMANFTNIGGTVFGMREVSGSRDLPFKGYLRNIILQPVAHTAQNRIDLGNL